jgi:hypothetical protein
MVQRQIKPEPVSDTTLRLIMPNLPAPEVTVVPVSAGPGWRIAVERVAPDGGKTILVQTEVPFERMDAAWYAAFELLRQHVIV